VGSRVNSGGPTLRAGSPQGTSGGRGRPAKITELKSVPEFVFPDNGFSGRKGRAAALYLYHLNGEQASYLNIWIYVKIQPTRMMRGLYLPGAEWVSVSGPSTERRPCLALHPRAAGS
jgi:hypothetical protein